MKTDFIQLKKEFVNKKVADTNQFIENVVYNYHLLEHCRDLILTLTTEFDRRVSENSSKIQNELNETGNASITALDDSFEVFGLKTNLSILISKNVKDIIQYANNILDSLAQVVNHALINPQLSKDKVDFGYLLKKNYLDSVTTTNIKQVFTNINSDSQLSYLRKSNNRIKHIMDIPTSLKYKPFGDEVTAIISEFKKNNIKFADVNIKSKCNDICNFISDCIDNICSAITLDMNSIHHEYRFNCINIYGQIPKKKSIEDDKLTFKDADFIVAYLEINESDLSKIPSQLELISATIRNDDTIEVFNYDYDMVLIKVGDRYEGYAVADEPFDNEFHKYRKYNVILDNQNKFYELLATNTKMKLYPMASKGQFTVYESDEVEK